MRISLELFSLPLDSGMNIPFIKSGKIQSKLNLRHNESKLKKQQNSGTGDCGQHKTGPHNFWTFSLLQILVPQYDYLSWPILVPILTCQICTSFGPFLFHKYFSPFMSIVSNFHHYDHYICVP